MDVLAGYVSVERDPKTRGQRDGKGTNVVCNVTGEENSTTNGRQNSLRKFFKKQKITAGAPESHVGYWMGHLTETYNQVASLGIEKQRQEYAAAIVTIRSRAATALQPLKSLSKPSVKTRRSSREFTSRLTDIAATSSNARKLSLDAPKQGSSSKCVAPPRGFEPLAASVLGTL